MTSETRSHDCAYLHVDLEIRHSHTMNSSSSCFAGKGREGGREENRGNGRVEKRRLTGKRAEEKEEVNVSSLSLDMVVDSSHPQCIPISPVWPVVSLQAGPLFPSS